MLGPGARIGRPTFISLECQRSCRIARELMRLRKLLRIIYDQLRRWFAHFKLCTHFL